MARFLAGVAAGLAAGALAAFITSTEAWWMAAGGGAALLVWFGHLAAEALIDALDDAL